MGFDFEFGVYELLYAVLFGMGAMVLFIVTKEKSNHKKIHTIAKSVGELQRQIFESEMRLNEKIKNIDIDHHGVTAAEVETLVDVTASDRVLPLEQAIKVVQSEFENLTSEVNARINSIENNIKSVSMARTSVGSTDDKKIRQLYHEGKTIDDIAKELRISSAEVEFSLKIAGFQ